MKRFYLLFLVLSIFSFISYSSYAEDNMKYLKITKPKGAERLYLGEKLDIEWKSYGLSGPVEIRLVSPSGSIVLAKSTSNDGKESLLTPPDITGRNDWQIIIEDKDENVFTASAKFDLSSLGQTQGEKFMMVTYPAGGENFKSLQTIEVRWQSAGIKGPIQIRFDYPGASIPILNSTENDGSETIQIPDFSSKRSDWHIVLTDYDENVWAVSKDFTVSKPAKK